MALPKNRGAAVVDRGGSVAPIGTVSADYEVLLRSDSRWALNEGGLHFTKESRVFESLRRIAKRLDEVGVPYAVLGGMALYHYGYHRFTEDIDVLVSAEGLAVIHDKLEGRGYRPPFAKSKNLRDTETGVRIEFLIAGEYPGDGKPKPVAFGEPDEDVTESDGIRYLGLARLVELKLASGMTNTGRMRDLADVQELIRLTGLKSDFAESLNPYVRDKFIELHQGIAEESGRRGDSE